MSVDLLVFFVFVTICAADSSTEFEVLVGRNLAVPSSCNEAFLVHIDSNINFTTGGYIVDPPCSIILLGGDLQNQTYKYRDVCYYVEELLIPCDNSYIVLEVWPLLKNVTEPSREDRFDCKTRADNKGFSICSEGFEFHLLIRIFANRTESFTDSIPVESIRLAVKEQRVNSGSGKPFYWAWNPGKYDLSNHAIDDCKIEDCSALRKIDELRLRDHLLLHKDTEDKTKVDSPVKPIDINNVITILGGVITSLFIPVILLFVRQYIRNKANGIPKVGRNPGDGSDETDGKVNGKEESDDELEVPTSTFLTPRHSIYSDTSSFHSTFSSV